MGVAGSDRQIFPRDVALTRVINLQPQHPAREPRWKFTRGAPYVLPIALYRYRVSSDDDAVRGKRDQRGKNRGPLIVSRICNFKARAASRINDAFNQINLRWRIAYTANATIYIHPYIASASLHPRSGTKRDSPSGEAEGT